MNKKEHIVFELKPLCRHFGGCKWLLRRFRRRLVQITSASHFPKPEFNQTVEKLKQSDSGEQAERSVSVPKPHI